MTEIQGHKKQMPATTEMWNRLIVRDPQSLSGLSVFEFVDPIIKKANIASVVASDLEGAYSGLRDLKDVIISSVEFLEKVVQATQYDWAFSFLYRESMRPLLCGSDHRSMIAAADITIRLVDDTYIYVYSRAGLALIDLKGLWPQAEAKSCSSADLDIPY